MSLIQSYKGRASKSTRHELDLLFFILLGFCNLFRACYLRKSPPNKNKKLNSKKHSSTQFPSFSNQLPVTGSEYLSPVPSDLNRVLSSEF